MEDGRLVGEKRCVGSHQGKRMQCREMDQREGGEKREEEVGEKETTRRGEKMMRTSVLEKETRRHV